MTLGRNPSGGHRIDRYAEGGQLVRHAPTPPDLTAFGCDVGAELRNSAMKDLAGDIDDPSPIAFLHSW